MSSSKRRIQNDVSNLLMSNYDVELVNDNLQEFHVKFLGPPSTAYEGGVWKVHVELPDDYPYKSPSIGFTNTIYHPNIDETSGSVCLDVINQTWSPMFDIFNIFEIFLPQLLSYPNADDPLNGDASHLYMNDKASYNEKIKEYVKKYASNQNIFKSDNVYNYKNKNKNINKNNSDDDDDDDDNNNINNDSDDDLSSVESFGSDSEEEEMTF
ncbi:E2 ubiquitin-conjugating protein UBC8 ASCRUDRAFT_78873 [Ascoidea rubescens DSM 1968]|uniref:UBC core domain-containing protein n=1 Tax=Ascoidea rubescens DSM 1968 TaxID=1344418 RepID=A0A1D2VQJ8_9ASCO|nr:hypothetical protein ASCRUDRAFT_78873 [Ascoidea rubescens DSM 1968]ODV63886.1 hypothetical protein ASCRUDRAFT_78873 [Ascoidea rubescens DSM 1968]